MQNKDLIIIALIVAMIYLYYQNRKLHKLTHPSRTFVATNSENNSASTIYELDEDLIAEKDAAIRSKNETEQELISVSNKFKFKNQEVTKKEQEIERLKNEKSKVEISLNEKIKEWKTKYSKQGQLLDTEQLENNKLVEKIEKLETKITELGQEKKTLLVELNKHDDLDDFQTWLNENEERKVGLPDWDKVLGEIKDKISDYHLQEKNWASGLLTRNTKYWQVFKNWLEEND